MIASQVALPRWMRILSNFIRSLKRWRSLLLGLHWNWYQRGTETSHVVGSHLVWSSGDFSIVMFGRWEVFANPDQAILSELPLFSIFLDSRGWFHFLFHVWYQQYRSKASTASPVLNKCNGRGSIDDDETTEGSERGDLVPRLLRVCSFASVLPIGSWKKRANQGKRKQYVYRHINGGFHKWGFPKMVGLQWTIPFLHGWSRGTPYFRKPPYVLCINTSYSITLNLGTGRFEYLQ